MFKTLKKNAKRSMSGAWGRSIGIMFLLMIPGIIINLVETILRRMTGVESMMDYAQTPTFALDNMANLTGVSFLITLLVSALLYLIIAPLTQGLYRWFYRRTGGEQDGVSGLFHYFESGVSYGRSLGLRFFIDLRIALWSILLSIPIVVITVIAIAFSTTQQEGAIMPLLLLLMFGWLILMIVVLTIIQLRYFLAPYLLADNPELTAKQALKSGIKQMRGHKGKVFAFGLSFFLWYLPIVAIFMVIMFISFVSESTMVLLFGLIVLLSLAQFGIMFYLFGYQNAALAMYARYIIESGRSAAQGDMTREYNQLETPLPGIVPETVQRIESSEPPKPEL